MPYKVGIIGVVKEELENDLWGTVAQLAKLGYQGLEGTQILAKTEQETRDNRKRLEDLGMESVAIRCSHYKEEELPQMIEQAHWMGAPFVADYWAGPKDQKELAQLAEQLDRMALQVKEAGLRMIYHNHEHEFVPKYGEKGNVRMFDYLYEHTEHLYFELDIAWCHFGGSDPVEIIRRFGDRIPILHVKDLADDKMRGYFSAVGCGKVDCFHAMEAAAAKGTEWMVVEQDRPGRLTPMESATASILNIREAGLL